MRHHSVSKIYIIYIMWFPFWITACNSSIDPVYHNTGLYTFSFTLSCSLMAQPFNGMLGVEVKLNNRQISYRKYKDYIYRKMLVQEYLKK